MLGNTSSVGKNAPNTSNLPAEGEGNDRKRNNKGGGTQSRSRKKGGSVYVQNLNTVFFEGANKDVEVVLRLRNKRKTKKFHFGVFQEKLEDYVVTILMNGVKIRVTIKNMKDPAPLFENKHNPK